MITRHQCICWYCRLRNTRLRGTTPIGPNIFELWDRSHGCWCCLAGCQNCGKGSLCPVRNTPMKVDVGKSLKTYIHIDRPSVYIKKSSWVDLPSPLIVKLQFKSSHHWDRRWSRHPTLMQLCLYADMVQPRTNSVYSSIGSQNRKSHWIGKKPFESVRIDLNRHNHWTKPNGSNKLEKTSLGKPILKVLHFSC